MTPADWFLLSLVGLAMLSTGLSTGAAYLAWRFVKDCQDEATSITRARRKIESNEEAIDALARDFRSLRGRFYKSKSDMRAELIEEPQNETADEVRARLRREHALPKVRPNGAVEGD